MLRFFVSFFRPRAGNQIFSFPIPQQVHRDHGKLQGGTALDKQHFVVIRNAHQRAQIRKDLEEKTPVYMRYDTHAENESMYNTPNCWAIYVCGKVFQYLLKLGGLGEMQKRNEDKAAVLYDYLDNSQMFNGTVEKQFRSMMNVPFVTASKELDAEVVAASVTAGFDNLKGHKSVGGLRASIYNAMPKDGVEALVAFLKDFEEKHG